MLDLGTGLLGIGPQALQQDHELIPTQARHGIQLAQRCLQPVGYLAEQLIANLMAMQVVDILEVVQVHENQRSVLDFLLGALAFADIGE